MTLLSTSTRRSRDTQGVSLGLKKLTLMQIVKLLTMGS